MKTIIVSNSKGGIGKSTTADAVASILKRKGFNTLLIDADLQCNSTDLYKAKVEGEATLYDVILDENPTNINEAIQHTEAGDIIAGDPLLRKADIILNGNPDGIFKLSEALSSLTDYDYVVIDTAPAINIILHNCLVAADEVVIPITADRFALQGISELTNNIAAIKKRYNQKLEIAGILLVKYHENQSLEKSVVSALENISEQIGTRVFNTKIRECSKVRQAQTKRMQLMDYSPACTSARDYWNFVEELING